MFLELWKIPCATTADSSFSVLCSQLPILKLLFPLRQNADSPKGLRASDAHVSFSLTVRLGPRDAGELLREPGGRRVRENDEPGLLGQVQALDPLKDLPWDDPLAPGGRPGLRHPDPDAHQMAVRLGLCLPRAGARPPSSTRVSSRAFQGWRGVRPLRECPSL